MTETPARNLHLKPGRHDLLLRCQTCEQQREYAQQRGRRIEQQRGALSLFPEVTGF